MACLNEIVTVSFETGADQEVSTSGLALMAPKTPLGALAVAAFACSDCGRKKEPLTSLPGLLVLGSETERAASPAVEMTFAPTELMYSPATPGMNEPSCAGVEPRVSASVAATVPPGDVCGGAGQPPHAIESRPATDEPLLVMAPVAVSMVTTLVAPPKSFTTPHRVEPSQAKSADEIRLPVLLGVPLSLTPLVTAPVAGSIRESGPKSPSRAAHSQPLRSNARPSPQLRV